MPFVPIIDESPESRQSEGRPYLHGSLAVRLLLTGCGNHLLVQVGGSDCRGGRPLDVDDFLTRAEGIELRRARRPVPIAEEAEANNFTVPESLQKHQEAPSRTMMCTGGDTSSLGKSLVSPLPASPSGGPVPWKTLFKAHWNGSNRPGAVNPLSGMGMP